MINFWHFCVDRGVPISLKCTQYFKRRGYSHQTQTSLFKSMINIRFYIVFCTSNHISRNPYEENIARDISITSGMRAILNCRQVHPCHANVRPRYLQHQVCYAAVRFEFLSNGCPNINKSLSSPAIQTCCYHGNSTMPILAIATRWSESHSMRCLGRGLTTCSLYFGVVFW